MSYATLGDVFSNARFRTGTSTNDFSNSDANLLALANKYFRRIVGATLDVNEDVYAEIVAQDLTDGGNPYTISAESSLSGGETLRLLRVEVTYDGTEWKVATPLDYEEIATPTITEADIDNNFSTGEPFYAVLNNEIHMLPDADSTVTDGLRTWQIRRRKELVASTDVFTDADGTGEFQMPKEAMDVMEDYLTADLHERLGNLSSAIAVRQQGEQTLDQLKNRWKRWNENFDKSVKVVADYDD